MARPKLKFWLLFICVKSIYAQEKPSGWRLESVEPNIIRHGDWINLYVSVIIRDFDFFWYRQPANRGSDRSEIQIVGELT